MKETKNRKILIIVAVAAALGLGSFTISSMGAPTFQDVDEDQWYSESVHKVADEKVMSGVAENFFDPESATTRAMLATVLWRADGAPAVEETAGTAFSDLTRDWYRQGVQYLSAEGRVRGYPDGTFRPDREVTRAEAAVMIGNSVANRTVSDPVKLTAFKDEEKIPSWAKKGIEDCQLAGIIGGYTDGTFRPEQTITRAELAKMLAVFLELPIREEDPETDPSDSDAVTDKLISTLIGDSRDNYLISPLSLKGAFALAANGAEGETLQEILDTLGMGDLEEYNAYFRRLNKKYTAAEEAITVDLNNSIWINGDRTLGFEFKEDYEKALEKYYDAQAGVVHDEDAVETINGWISEKTRDKIQNCINSSDFTSMLVNTLYFKGAWVHEFSKGATQKGTFTDAEGKKVRAPLMHMTENVEYYQDGTTQMISLPYDKAAYEKDGETGGDKIKSFFSDMDISMYVVLSEKPVDIAAFIKDAKPRMTTHRIVITLPKFTFDSRYSMKEALQAMGIRKAFTDQAEFTKMSDLEQMISDVIQSTYIAVDEEGTEAAAATVISMETTSVMPEEPYAEFTADRPFQFAIRDNKSGEILFVGGYNKVE